MSDEDVTTGEVGRGLTELKEAVKAMGKEQRDGQKSILDRFDSLHATYVPRGEWEMQNQITERDLKNALAMIATLKHQLIGVVVFVLTAALGIIGAYIQAGKLG